jgi:hypothetical protein
MAISRRRSEARASSRFATLAHAISKTNATAESRTIDAMAVSPVMSSRSDVTRRLHFAFVSGYCAARAAAKVRTSASAAPVLTPARSRPTIPIERSVRAIARASGSSGIHTCATSGNPKPEGMTPTIVRAMPFTRSVDPKIDGIALKRRRHSESPITTTGTIALRSSSVVKLRPSDGCTPIVEKRFADTAAPPTRSGPSPPDTAYRPSTYAASDANAVVRSRSSRNVGYDVPTEHPAQSSVALHSCTSARPASSWKGNGLNWMAFTKLKTAVFAPIPSASDATTTAVVTGDLKKMRIA